MRLMAGPEAPLKMYEWYLEKSQLVPLTEEETQRMESIWEESDALKLFYPKDSERAL